MKYIIIVITICTIFMSCDYDLKKCTITGKYWSKTRSILEVLCKYEVHEYQYDIDVTREAWDRYKVGERFP